MTENKELKNINNEIISQIVKARINSKMTQADLAEKSGTRQSNICRLESGNYNPTVQLLQKVAEALGMELQVKFKSKVNK